MLIVTGGIYKGRKIKVIDNLKLRPTLSKIRGAIFEHLDNIMLFSEYHFYDVFAGSGIMGIEALSRGFHAVSCIEQNHQNVNQLQKNLENLGIQEIDVIKTDALKWLHLKKTEQSKKLFFFDPPYNSVLLQRCIDIILKKKYARSCDFIVAEAAQSFQLQNDLSLKQIVKKVYGNTAIAIFEIEK